MNPCQAHGCSACCHDTEMPITEDDARRLETLGHARAEFSFRNAEGFLQLRTRDAEGPKPCFFLSEGQCGVYASRPAGCRIYPLVLNDQRRVVRDEDCPHRVEFLLDPAAKRRIERIYSQLRKDVRSAGRA